MIYLYRYYFCTVHSPIIYYILMQSLFSLIYHSFIVHYGPPYDGAIRAIIGMEFMAANINNNYAH